LLNTYKYGWKTSYYQNTYDYKVDPSDIQEEPQAEQQKELEPNNSDESCDACAI